MLFSDAPARLQQPSGGGVYTAAQRHASATRAGGGTPLAPRLAIPDNVLVSTESPFAAGSLPPAKRRLDPEPEPEPETLPADGTWVGQGPATHSSWLESGAPAAAVRTPAAATSSHTVSTRVAHRHAPAVAHRRSRLAVLDRAEEEGAAQRRTEAEIHAQAEHVAHSVSSHHGWAAVDLCGLWEAAGEDEYGPGVRKFCFSF